MKSAIEFLKTTAMGGILVIMPLLLLYITIAELLDLVAGIATTITSIFPENFLGPLDEHLLVAFLILFSTSFLVGLTLRSNLLKGLGKSLEDATVGKLAIYVALKRLSYGLLGSVNEKAFPTALMKNAEGNRQIVYIIEDNGDGLLTVFVPIAPMGMTGPVLLLDESRIERLPMGVATSSVVLGQFGLGLQEAIANPEG